MKLTRLRIAGFKTFVEPTEVLIEPGLTGIIGPNGCGKSNLVEALRWVMGESSHKNMRASGMDDVIFSGSGGRPARSTAEVTLVIDNEERRAPAGFNDWDTLEVSRKIAREEGSTYRVNGREVRARDVQLLFADAATGARSPALVRQGQIAELIAAKPQARRRVLEDAAGIAGLHARRHEAELRLRAAEDNLTRVEDVLHALDVQIEALRRQGRQATRYRNLSAEIRRIEALLHAVAYAEARAQSSAAERQAEADLSGVADAQARQTAAATAQAVAAHRLPTLREADAAAAAALQRLRQALAELDAEERRARERSAEVARQIAEIEGDLGRGAAQREDAAASLARLRAEEAELGQAADTSGPREGAAREAVAAADRALAEAEAEFGRLQAQVSDLNARRGALERIAREERGRAERFAGERARVARDLAVLDQAAEQVGPGIETLREEVEGADYTARQAEQRAAEARMALAGAREAEARLRGPLAEAERAAARLETEARTLAKLVAPAAGDFWPRALDQVTVAKGYEVALGAALGDDLDASTNESAPAHWAGTPPVIDDPALPAGVQPLSALVTAPAALARRLTQIGVVGRADGARLRPALRPGQRLVSREGDLWRWDGLTTAAEAPSPAARRLAERNRLGDLERDAATARAAASERRRAAEAAQATTRASAQEEAQAVDALTRARRALDEARARLAQGERREAERATRRSGLAEAVARLAASEDEAVERASEAEAALTALAPAPALESQLLGARVALAEQRSAAAEARNALQTLQRDGELRRRRLEAIAAETASWAHRAARAEAAAAELQTRLDRARAEQASLAEAPDTTLLRRRALLSQIEAAEAFHRTAADALASGESGQTSADREARAALDALSAAREARAGSQARYEAALQRVAQVTRAIEETLETTPAGLSTLAGLKAGEPVPPAADAEARLSQLKSDRERLGAVNLRADEELAELEAKRHGLANERDDLVEAIRRLRQAIGSLNREGRERLLAAFEVVNGHFQRLFTTLFGGGTAELTLVDSDDPLEAGLEILARPPGKKPQTMTLLSGGEQALTATALIFAVFLTNPSPICVLDEVDAPLDDANVERYCDLLDDMAARTDTRFVVITHNPITMARMDRLLGVTMAERGVSQMVSVDLERAQALREAS